MKRFFVLLSIALLLGAWAFAEEAVLIDFSKIAADYPSDDPDQNSATMVDFSQAAGATFSDEEKAHMVTSLAIENWEVILNSSARTVENQSNSYTRTTTVKEDAKQYAGEKVMGVRIRFPEEPFNATAVIKPPFEIPAYMDTTEVQDDGTLVVPEGEARKGRKFDNMGIVKNVGILKSITVTLYGRNFPHELSIIIADENNMQQTVKLGYVQTDGWTKLEWVNSEYINDVRNRELIKAPLYPKSAPFVKLAGFAVRKDSTVIGGDSVLYLKDVNIIYDKAVLDLEGDIDDESVWNILQDRENARRAAELKRLGQLQVLRYLEQQKMHAEQGSIEE